MVKPGACGNAKAFKVGLEYRPSMVHNYRFSYHNVDWVNQLRSMREFVKAVVTVIASKFICPMILLLDPFSLFNVRLCY
ncbi:hypothetical protein Pelo_18996 [Pelomyxa schiedti]|nr:hypothetical protein Pelo_18996 [Pelomyxa schiedti]